MKTIKKNFPLIILMWFVVFTFFVGLGVCLSPNITRESMMSILSPTSKEAFQTETETESETCPNMLLKKGNQLMLVFANLPKSESNPLFFNTLEEYSAFVETQRAEGIRCPILFLQEETNTQGDDVYRMRPNPLEMNGGGQVLPVQPTIQAPPGPVKIQDASRSGNVFNANQYPGFDSHGTYIGVYTTIDQVHDSTEKNKLSDNPMDPNWGGVTFSQAAVDSGKYSDRIVGKPIWGVPKVLP
jgi:hypothetical protein|uniref:Uncharacterized protein n=1 Tax=viral metagenome TaxID=1070528 RepID=A0A6C0HHY8_9ZZZZ